MHSAPATQGGARSAPWRPVLEGPDQRRALEAVAAVAAHATQHCAGDLVLTVEAALLHSQLVTAGLDRGAGDLAALVDASFELASTCERGTWDPIGGFAEVAWALARLGAAHPELGVTPSSLSSITQPLAAELAAGHPVSHDLVSGLTGFGVLALELGAAGGELLTIVLERLARSAVHADGGAAWFTPVEFLGPGQRASYPAGVFDAGVAHGVGGPIGLLGHVAAEAPARSREACALLTPALRWLDGAVGGFGRSAPAPFMLPVGGAPVTSTRPGWCYGDVGLALPLTSAARATGDPALERHAIERALRALAIAPAASGVVDAGLCHGAAGILHACARLHQVSGAAGFRQAASVWLRRALALAPGLEADGLVPIAAERGGVRGMFRQPGLLQGATGFALALLAAATGDPPRWDRMLLLDGPRGLA